MEDVKKKNLDAIHLATGGGNDEALSLALSEVQKQYPFLSGLGIEAAYGDPKRNTGGGYLEFYPPDEERNPRPGVPYIEMYDRSVRGPDLVNMLFGDALHYVPVVDKDFASMREQFSATLTPRQREVDQRAYQRAMREYGESRKFDDWFNVSRLDAYIRGYLAPDKNNEWAGIYTPQQKEILEQMRARLRSKR